MASGNYVRRQETQRSQTSTAPDITRYTSPLSRRRAQMVGPSEKNIYTTRRSPYIPNDKKLYGPKRQAYRSLPSLQSEDEEDTYKLKESVPQTYRSLPFLQPKEKITSILHTNQIVINEFPKPASRRSTMTSRYFFMDFLCGLLLILFTIIYPDLTKILPKLGSALSTNLLAFGTACWQLLSRPDVSAVIQSIGGLIGIVTALVAIPNFIKNSKKKQKIS